MADKDLASICGLVAIFGKVYGLVMAVVVELQKLCKLSSPNRQGILGNVGWAITVRG